LLKEKANKLKEECLMVEGTDQLSPQQVNNNLAISNKIVESFLERN
jgi:hypothetical protein